MKRKIPLLLSFSLLFSCASLNAPEEIVTFINGCSLLECQNNTKTIKYEYSSNMTRGKEGIVSSISSTIIWDNSKDDFYKYVKEDYSLEAISYDEEKEMYVTKKESTTSYHSEDNMYYQIDTFYGYKNNDEDLKITQSPIKYKADSISDIKYGIFSSNQTEWMSTGGLYYADYFYSNLAYYEYMAIEEDNLVMNLVDYPYKNETESGLIQEKIMINDMGLLTSLYHEANNGEKQLISRLNINVIYNEEVTRV